MVLGVSFIPYHPLHHTHDGKASQNRKATDCPRPYDSTERVVAEDPVICSNGSMAVVQHPPRQPHETLSRSDHGWRYGSGPGTGHGGRTHAFRPQQQPSGTGAPHLAPGTRPIVCDWRASEGATPGIAPGAADV